MKTIKAVRKTTESLMGIILDFAPLAPNYREKICTPIPFLNHMIEHIAYRAGFNIKTTTELTDFTLVHVIAEDLGMEVERRPVHVDELSTFEEVGECGTAVVITPVHKLVDKPFLESDEETVYTYGDGTCGPKSLELYKFITGLQKGEIEDPFGWINIVEL